MLFVSDPTNFTFQDANTISRFDVSKYSPTEMLDFWRDFTTCCWDNKISANCSLNHIKQIIIWSKYKTWNIKHSQDKKENSKPCEFWQKLVKNITIDEIKADVDDATAFSIIQSKIITFENYPPPTSEVLPTFETSMPTLYEYDINIDDYIPVSLSGSLLYVVLTKYGVYEYTKQKNLPLLNYNNDVNLYPKIASVFNINDDKGFVILEMLAPKMEIVDVVFSNVETLNDNYELRLEKLRSLSNINVVDFSKNLTKVIFKHKHDSKKSFIYIKYEICGIVGFENSRFIICVKSNNSNDLLVWSSKPIVPNEMNQYLLYKLKDSFIVTEELKEVKIKINNESFNLLNTTPGMYIFNNVDCFFYKNENSYQNIGPKTTKPISCISEFSKTKPVCENKKIDAMLNSLTASQKKEFYDKLKKVIEV